MWVHQGSVLSLILSVPAGGIRGSERRGTTAPYCLQVTLVVNEETAEGKEKFRKMEGLEKTGLKINMQKIKCMVTGGEARERIESRKYPRGWRGMGVGVSCGHVAGSGAALDAQPQKCERSAEFSMDNSRKETTRTRN